MSCPYWSTALTDQGFGSDFAVVSRVSKHYNMPFATACRAPSALADLSADCRESLPSVWKSALAGQVPQGSLGPSASSRGRPSCLTGSAGGNATLRDLLIDQSCREAASGKSPRWHVDVLPFTNFHQVVQLTLMLAAVLPLLPGLSAELLHHAAAILRHVGPTSK